MNENNYPLSDILEVLRWLPEDCTLHVDTDSSIRVEDARGMPVATVSFYRTQPLLQLIP